MARHANGPLRLLLSGLPIAFVRVAGCLPLSWARLLGRCVGTLAYYAVPKIRRVGMANLALAFGDSMDDAEKRRILRDAVRNVGLVAAEFGHREKLTRDVAEKLVKVEGVDHIDKSKGFVLIGGHFGNWEWMPPVLQRNGLAMAVVYRPLDDPWLDGFIGKARAIGGVLPVPKSEAGRGLMRHLREGGVAGILVDQSPRDNAVPITFFGEQTWATAAPAFLAVRTKLPIHAAYMVREKDGCYTLHITEAIPLRKSGAARADLVENSQRCHAVLEDIIRAHPDHWLWFHRRWKPRPQLEEAWRARENREGSES